MRYDFTQPLNREALNLLSVDDINEMVAELRELVGDTLNKLKGFMLIGDEEFIQEWTTKFVIIKDNLDLLISVLKDRLIEQHKKLSNLKHNGIKSEESIFDPNLTKWGVIMN